MVILCIVLTKYFILCSKIELVFFPKSDVRPVGFFRNRVGFLQQPAAISTLGDTYILMSGTMTITGEGDNYNKDEQMKEIKK